MVYDLEHHGQNCPVPWIYNTTDVAFQAQAECKVLLTERVNDFIIGYHPLYR